MAPLNDQPYREHHRKALRVSFYLLGSVAVLGGLLLRFWSKGKEDIGSQFLGEIGTFLAVTFLVSFVYERFIASQERRHFIDDLERVLTERASELSKSVRVHEEGRPQLAEKVKLIQSAKHEVLEVGVALRTFTSYFEMHPSQVYRVHIEALLKRGVNYTCYVLDPESPHVGNLGGQDLKKKIETSLTSLNRLKADFDAQQWPGKFTIQMYSETTHFACLCVDGGEQEGQLFYTPYLFETRNADCPCYFIQKANHPVMFKKLYESIICLKEACASGSPAPGCGTGQ